jgi:CBS domain-containing protein
MDEKVCKVDVRKKISPLVVEDNRGNLKDILTKTDLIDGFIRYFAGEHLVNEFMTKSVLAVAPEEPIHMAIMLMTNYKVSRVIVAKDHRSMGIISGLPVVDPKDSLKGIITKTDIVKAPASHA